MAEAFRSARATAWVASFLVLASWGGLLAWLLAGRVSHMEVLVGGMAPLALLGALLLVLHARVPAAREASWPLETAAALLGGLLVLAVAGHLLGPFGASQRPWLTPPDVGRALDVPPVVALLPFLFAALGVPLLAGARVAALGLTLDATGRAHGGLGACFAALGARSADDLVRRAQGRAVVGGVVRRWLEGLRLPGLLAADILLTWSAGLRGPCDRLHARIDLASLAEGLEALDAQVDPKGDALVVRLPGPEEGVDAPGAVVVRASRLRLPRLEASDVLEARGAPADLRRLRLAVEGALLAQAFFSWGRPARRMEARLNALLREAAGARTMEARGVLLDEATRLLDHLGQRDLGPEDASILRAWKGEATRVRLLGREPEETGGDRTAAPAPALAPRLEHVMGAGGLDVLGRVSYVPHWVLPVETPWGECEIVVDAITQVHEPAESLRLLEAMESHPPRMLETQRGSTFLPTPPPTAALLGQVRERLPAHVRPREDAVTGEGGVEVVYVPFVAVGEGRVNLVTGSRGAEAGTVRPSRKAPPAEGP